MFNEFKKVIELSLIRYSNRVKLDDFDEENDWLFNPEYWREQLLSKQVSKDFRKSKRKNKLTNILK